MPNFPLPFFKLPENLIAQSPAIPRDSSRLMVIDKKSGKISHHVFRDLPLLLTPNDVLVFNDTRVFPARLHGQKNTGGKVEILLLKQTGKSLWEVISHPGLKPGQTITFLHGVQATVINPNLVEFNKSSLLRIIGETPLPPYIHSHQIESKLRRQYQTVYAKHEGSAAAPTAGLHFTPRLLSALKKRSIQMENLTLHVGLGTFKPPTPEQISAGILHTERFTLSADTANRLNSAKTSGKRIVAVGTTTTRVLETCSDSHGVLHPKSGETNIFIKPPYQFKFVDKLITNFHTPESSLIMLVAAFSTPDIVKNAYRKAIALRYRFFSFGDATLFQ